MSLHYSNYSPGHPWYYILGGPVLYPKQIRTKAYQTDRQSYKSGRINAADELTEPKRSQALLKLRSEILDELQRDLRRYRETVSALGRYRSDQRNSNTTLKCESVHSAICLKYNHVYGGFLALQHVNDVRAKTPELFDWADINPDCVN